MKKFFALLFAFTFVLYLSTVTSAQGKAVGQQGRGPEVGRGHDIDHNKPHTGTQAQQGQPEKNWEQRLEQNTALRMKVEKMLPPGTDLKTAEMGFRNQGQFIAALHVYKNHPDIPFDQLQAKMTGPNPMSLGQAIHALKPTISEQDAHKEAEKAEQEAKTDLRTKPATKPLS